MACLSVCNPPYQSESRNIWGKSLQFWDFIKAWSISHKISSSVSGPTDSRIMWGLTPAVICSSSVN
ncbi:MAG: hypothetical protein CM1200mP18_07550 [Gammaproteobacteria bacterium]|nr:MAG: hypothetical protein CM1200mP18_07550 [Gammaproteobacteria bacterium]